MINACWTDSETRVLIARARAPPLPLSLSLSACRQVPSCHNYKRYGIERYYGRTERPSFTDAWTHLKRAHLQNFGKTSDDKTRLVASDNKYLPVFSHASMTMTNVSPQLPGLLWLLFRHFCENLKSENKRQMKY